MIKVAIYLLQNNKIWVPKPVLTTKVIMKKIIIMKN